MKKILALVLALMCAFSFASCGKSETKSEETVKKTPEQEATDTINGFMTALTSFDFEDMKKYVANTDVLPEDIRQFDIKALLKEKSPSCGSGMIHNGKFDGGLIKGFGKTAALLLENRFEVFGESEIEKL